MSVRVTRTARASRQGDLVESGGPIGAAHAGFFKDTRPVSRAGVGTEITLEARLAGD